MASAVPTAAASASPAPSLPPLIADGVARVLALLRGPSDAAIQAEFSPRFLAAIPAEKVKAVLTATTAGAGACGTPTLVEQEDEATARVHLECEHGGVTLTIRVGVTPPHLIDGLLVTPDQ